MPKGEMSQLVALGRQRWDDAADILLSFFLSLVGGVEETNKKQATVSAGPGPRAVAMSFC